MEKNIGKINSDQFTVTPEEIAFGRVREFRVHGQNIKLPPPIDGEEPGPYGLTRSQQLFIGAVEQDRRTRQNFMERFYVPEIGQIVLLPEDSEELQKYLNYEGGDFMLVETKQGVPAEPQTIEPVIQQQTNRNEFRLAERPTGNLLHDYEIKVEGSFKNFPRKSRFLEQQKRTHFNMKNRSASQQDLLDVPREDFPGRY